MSYSVLALAAVLLIGSSWAEETKEQVVASSHDQKSEMEDKVKINKKKVIENSLDDLLKDELEQRLAEKIVTDDLIEKLLSDPQYNGRERINIKIMVGGKGRRRGGYYGRRRGYGGYRGGYYDQDSSLHSPSRDQVSCQNDRCRCINNCDLIPTTTPAKIANCFKQCLMLASGKFNVCPL